MDNIGTTLKEIRVGHGLSAREVARQCGLSYATVSYIENNPSNPTLKTLASFARVFGIRTSDLVERIEFGAKT